MRNLIPFIAISMKEIKLEIFEKYSVTLTGRLG